MPIRFPEIYYYTEQDKRKSLVNPFRGRSISSPPVETHIFGKFLIFIENSRSVLHVLRAWFVRLYRKIIHKRKLIAHLCILHHVHSETLALCNKSYLSYDVAVIQWITSCHKNRMTTRYITLGYWRVTSWCRPWQRSVFYWNNVNF